MNNKKLTETIQNLFANKSNDVFFTPDEVIVAALHSYLFVKPIERKRTFFKDLMVDGMFAFVDSKEIQERTNTQLEHYIPYLMTSRRYMKTCRKWFDKRWFKKQLRFIDMEEEFNETLLEKYIKQLDEMKVACFYQLVVWLGYKEGLFVSADNCANVWTAVDTTCHKADATLPRISGNEEEFPMCIFEHLDKDYIVKLLLENIDKDVMVAAYLAKALYYSEPLIAREYLYLVAVYKAEFGLDIFSPVTSDITTTKNKLLGPTTLSIVEHGGFVKWLRKRD